MPPVMHHAVTLPYALAVFYVMPDIMPEVIGKISHADLDVNPFYSSRSFLISIPAPPLFYGKQLLNLATHF